MSAASPADPLRQVRQSIGEGAPMLRLSQRRPSVPTMERLSHFQERELTIAHEGWLTKHSKTGLPNWNRRWFVLIGGTLYYSKTSDEEHQMQRFAELMHAVRVEMVTGESSGFRLVLTDQTLHFQAVSAEARLEWCAQLESHIGMQPVPLEVLQNCLRKESTSDASVRLRALAAELLDKEAELRAAAARETELRETVAALQAALVAKDEQLWGLASDLAVATAQGGGAGPSALSEEASDRLTALVPSSSSGGSPSELRVSYALRANSDDGTLSRHAAAAAAPAAAEGSLSLLSERSGVHPERSLKKCNTCDCGKAVASAPAAAAASDARPTLTGLLGRKGSNVPGVSKGDSATSLAGKVAGGGGALAASLGLRKPTAKVEAPSPAEGGVNRKIVRRGSAPMTTLDVGRAVMPPAPANQARSRSHTASDMQLPGGSTSSQLNGCISTGAGAGAQLRVSKQGWLTKFSKGGFTANWNRRAFVLIGSSLYYARTHEALPSRPQLFAELHLCEVLPWADYATAQQNVFGVHVYAGVDAEHALPSPRKGHEGRDPDLLLLAADTGKEKFEWMQLIEEARRLPPCPAELVAPKIAQAHALAVAQGANLHDHPPRPLYKRTSTDSKLVAASPEATPPQSPRHISCTPGSSASARRSEIPRSVPSSAERPTPNPAPRPPTKSDSSASGGMFGSMLDRIMPDFVKDI